MSRYEISIVTPFHNIKPEVFAAGVKGMKAQTYGFENIEWIVVIHNCDDRFKRSAHEALDGYDNVVVRELDNDRRTPSSPRNYGMSLATGDYIGFLDGDDSFTPECIEVVLEAIKRNKAQVVSFRREFELEKPDGIPITEIILLDLIEKEIVFDKEHWDDQKMFTGLCGLVTSRMYDRHFLVENNLTFDESILFAEDYLFNLEVYDKLEKVVYLPQFIGYHYFINGGSLVQSGAKTPEILIQYAEGYVKIFETGLKNGFYMNSIISRLTVTLARFLMQCQDMTMEQRHYIRDLLAPFINRTTMMEPSKVYSAKVVKESYEVPRLVILNPEEWLKQKEDGLLTVDKDGVDVFTQDNAQTLAHILENNQNTDMGRHYSFWDIMTVKQFCKKLPLSDYSDLAPLIRLATGIGEKNIITSREIAAYVGEETEEGIRQIFPLTKQQARGHARAFFSLLSGHKTFLFPDKVKGGAVRYNDAVYANTIPGVVIQQMFSHIPGESKPDVTSPDALFFCEDDFDTRYLHMLFALRERDVDQIFQPKCRWTLRVFEYMEEYWPTMCDDIEHGTVSRGDRVPDSLADMMKTFFVPDKERADELRKIFEEGFETPIAGRIWKNLKNVYSNMDADGEAFRKLTERYLGEIPCQDVYFVTSGTILGLGDASEGSRYIRLINHAAFYEFIPEADAQKTGEVQTLTMKNVREGERYELVITTDAGLYRFRTGSVIKIEKIRGDHVWFTY